MGELGGFVPPKVLMGGLTRGHRPYGGPDFDRLYHKLNFYCGLTLMNFNSIRVFEKVCISLKEVQQARNTCKYS